MSDPEDLPFFKGMRTTVRSKCTRLCNGVNRGDFLQPSDIRNCIEDLKDIKSELKKLDSDVLRCMYKSKVQQDVLDAEHGACEDYQNKITLAVRTLQSSLEAAALPPSPTGNQASFGQLSANPGNQIKLPQIPLPEYNHSEGESFENFISNFESVINKYNVSNFEKYIYLERQVKGEALTLIKSLRGNDRSYDEAHKLLTKAFASPIVQKFEVMQKMANLNLKYNGNCYQFVSDMRVIIHSFNSLKISTDDVLQFFLWNAMPFSLQNQLMSITNNNKPSVAEIEENIFSAIERFQAIQKRKTYVNSEPSNFVKKGTTNNFAANVSVSDSFKGRPCILCSDRDNPADHSINKCSKYLTPKSKIGKLKNIKACYKCGNLSHQAESCVFRFHKNCYHCKGLHFSYLCPNESNSATFDSKKNEVKISNHMINLEATTLNFESNFPTILPTFTANLSGNQTLHCIKDTGAQCAIILADIADRYGFKLVEYVDLSINGFNVSKPFKTKIVEVPLLIKNKTKIIKAVCVPKINIKLKLKGLNSLVAAFVKRKVILADKTILDLNEGEEISKIEMILGADYAHLLPENSLLFSGSGCNCFNSPFGVVLMGNLDTIKKNVVSMPNSEFKSGANPSNCKSAVATPGCEGKFQVGFSDSEPLGPKSLLARGNNEFKNSESVNVNLTPVLREPCTKLKNSSVVGSKFDEVNLDQNSFDVIANLNPQFLDEKCEKILMCENEDFLSNTEVNPTVDEILLSVSRDVNGRIVVPILWNDKNKHLLAKNFNLSKQILSSHLKKFRKDKTKLEMIDDVFQGQVQKGIIGKIENLNEFLDKNPESSFMPHMPVFRMDKDTTKCRNVFLSNLAEISKNHINLSHNQTIPALI